MNSFLKKTFCFLLVSCLCVFAASLFLKVNADVVPSTFTFTSKSWEDSTNSFTSGQDGGQLSSGRGIQVSTTYSGANATSNSSFNNVSSIVVTYSTNASKGAGNIEIQVGTNDAVSKNVTKDGGTDDRTLTWDYSPAQSGVVKITVNCTTNSIYVKSITINEEYVGVSGVALNKDSTSIAPGNTEQLTATILPNDATNKNVTWSSSDNAVATVSETGLVTAVASGSATITATSQDDGTKSASCLVTVTAAVPATGVEVTDTESSYVGGTRQLSANVLPANASNKNVSWSSADENIATVSSTGLVTAVAIGIVSITATTEDGHFTDSCIFEVRDFPAANTELSVAEALEIAEVCGETQSANTYITIGTVKTKKTTAQFILTDGVNDILVYKSSHGCEVGDKVKVSGNLKVYNSELEYAATSVKKFFSVTFNSNGGSEVAGLVDVEEGSKINSPANPTKAGYPFAGWYKEEGFVNAWNFETDTVTSNITLYAKWQDPAPIEFSLLQTRASLNYDYNRVATGTKEAYVLYSGALTEGDYIIYYNGKAMNTTITSKRFQYVEVTPVGDVIDTANTAIIWHIAQSGEYWTIYNAAANMYAASTGSKNEAAMIEDGTDDKALWSVTGISTYEFVNKQNTTNKVNANLRNNGTYGFATYADSTGGALSLYKKTSVNVYSYPINKDLGGKNILSLQFRGFITSDLKNRLEQGETEVSYGVLYGKTSDIETEFKGMSGLLDNFLNDGYWLSDIDDLAPGKLRYTVISSNNLQGVDATGTSVDNDDPEYYQFGVSINKISDANINTSITVAAYVCIDGTYYIMQQASYSVKTLASEYVNAQDTSDYTEHLKALEYLASYGD